MPSLWWLIGQSWQNLCQFKQTPQMKLLFDKWVKHNNMLEVIVSDWDVKFMSKFWILLINFLKIKLKFDIVCHLKIDGLTLY